MKVETLVLLALATGGSSATIQSRQNWPNGFLDYVPMIEKVAKPMTPSKVLDAEPRIRPNASRKKFRFGPFTLPPAKVGHAATRIYIY
jgi:hypothetical protein